MYVESVTKYFTILHQIIFRTILLDNKPFIIIVLHLHLYIKIKFGQVKKQLKSFYNELHNFYGTPIFQDSGYLWELVFTLYSQTYYILLFQLN